ncbi:MerR family transcriptional regulator [Kineococcus sp. SYSU DK004]|uniref:MerR family transcriptional regulator n=1 Tax=Kineococcus sp. SYSU DK004 TaxID=3383125 RepID=UPI003D7D4133
MEWTVAQVARAAGTTPRTLRHYDEVGLLPPSRTGANGYRYYDGAALLRLQRILLLRGMGVGLPAIADLLAARTDAGTLLRQHLELLREQEERLRRRSAAVRAALGRVERGEELDVDEVFDGFEGVRGPEEDGRRWEEEVVARWGRGAWEDGRRAWESLGPDGRAAALAEHDAVGRGLAAALGEGAPAGGERAQDLVRRHHAWVSRSWVPGADAYRGLADTYVEDERFRATYEAFGPGTARYLRDAAHVFAARELT